MKIETVTCGNYFDIVSKLMRVIIILFDTGVCLITTYAVWKKPFENRIY